MNIVQYAKYFFRESYKPLQKHEQPKEQFNFTAYDFVGSWSKEDAALIEKASEEGCE